MSDQAKPARASRGAIARRFFTNNSVTILFLVIGISGLWVSGLSLPFFFDDIINRMARNSFMAMALIIPVLAGLGLNFAVVLGAMAGQTAIILVTHWGIGGLPGILLCVVLSFPLAVVLGILTGRLLNRARGKEMITTLILGFFANGIYQLVFLILVGTLIPMNNDILVLSSGVGIRTSIDLTGGLRNGLDDVFKLTLPVFALLASLGFLAASVWRFIRVSKDARRRTSRPGIVAAGVASLAVAVWSALQLSGPSMFAFVKVPVGTYLVVALLCVFTAFFMKTKQGQDMRTVGQDRHIADVSGIHSDRVRINAMVMSTVLAAVGQIIFLQNLGNFSTYGSHENTGMFAIAALLIGGASVARATIAQALIGTALFHTIFIVSPLAGRVLFGEAQLGEFFRAFVAYGIIGISLALHSWKTSAQAREAERLLDAE